MRLQSYEITVNQCNQISYEIFLLSDLCTFGKFTKEGITQDLGDPYLHGIWMVPISTELS